MPIPPKKHIHQHKRDSFVSIRERVVPAHMKAVCGSLVEDRFMEELPAAGPLRLRERGRKQPAVTDACPAAVAPNQVRVDQRHDFIRLE